MGEALMQVREVNRTRIYDKYDEQSLESRPSSCTGFMGCEAYDQTASPRVDARAMYCPDEFVLFCSEWPEAEAPEFSNCYNLAYTVGCYKGANGDDYWCSEKEFVLRKVEEFCCNEAAKREQIALIKSMEPKPVIPYGESGREMVWEYNH